LDPDKVIVVGEDTLTSVGSGILVSTDAGATWSNPGGTWVSQPGTVGPTWKEVWYANSDTIWTVGWDGAVALSTDGGLTFNRVSRPLPGVDNYTQAIFAIDAFTAVVAGSEDQPSPTANSAFVWKTTDGGVSWTMLNGGTGLTPLPGGPPGAPGGIWMSPDTQRIVVGRGYGYDLSTDGGATFTPIPPQFPRSGRHLTWYPAYNASPSAMRLTGGPQLIVSESLDAGSTWTITRPTPDGTDMYGAHFYTQDDGYYTSGANVFITSDGAQTGVISYTEPFGFGLEAVWTQEALTPPPGGGCPCYLATNCDDPTEQVAIQVDCTVDTPFNTLTPGTVYQFSSPDYMVDKCWTVEEIDCPQQQTIDLGSGNISEGVPGAYNDQDYQWQVTNIVSGSTPIGPPLPFPARVANQVWYPGAGPNPPWGSQVGGQWITVGQLNNDGTTPHTQNVATAAYELQFTPPINFIPTLHLEFLIDNSATFFLNGVQINPSNSPTYPWNSPYIIDIDAVNNTQATFNAGVNILRVETVNTGGSGTNGINIIGQISNANPPSVEAVPVSEWIDCEDCLGPVTVPNICWDLEVACDQECDDIYAIAGFDFTPYIGQNITIQPPITDPECWYTPYALRQAVFISAPESSGGGYNLSWPFGAFQQGTDDITISIPSFIFNGVEQIAGPAPSYLLTPLNIQFVLCQQMACANVPLNNPSGINGYSNTVDFINQTLASLGILTMQAYNNSFDNCPIVQIKPRETFRLQYRDGDTFRLELVLSNTGQGVNTIVYEVGPGNVTTSYLNVADNQLNTCNDNIYCITDPDTSPQIIGVTVQGDCPVEPIDLGEACEIVPRLGEPGFSTKNCDPKKVIDVKTKFADSVYAQFKRVRYGIETCCEFDLDKIDIKNQLIDLGAIYDPGLCVSGTPIDDECCLQPCDAEAEIIIPNFITCPAPIDAIAILTTPIPETTCVEATLSAGPDISADVPASVSFRDCCGNDVTVDVIQGVPPITVCVDTEAPYSIGKGVIVSLGAACDCCPSPIDPVATLVVINPTFCISVEYTGTLGGGGGTVEGLLCNDTPFFYKLDVDASTGVLCVQPGTILTTGDVDTNVLGECT
jgi:hypothetical protein